jgi:hypothetical protein
MRNSLLEIINKLEGDVKLMEDECHAYKLRMESLHESEERHLKTIEKLKKELQMSETFQYRERKD